MKLLAVYVGTNAVSRLNLQHGLQHGIWGFKDNAKPVDFETLEAGDFILLATGHSGGGPRTSTENWAEHSLASISYAKITEAPFKDMQPEWPDEASLSGEDRYYWRVRFDPTSIKTITNISLKDSAKLSAELAENLRKSGAANGRGYVLDVSHFPAINLGKTNGKNNEAEIVKKLKARLEKGVPWSKGVEEYAATFGKLEPTQVAQLENEQLWKLWTASKFAETGTPGLPRPTADQWEGVRKMTQLLCDRSEALGERFEAAREVYLQTFTAEQVQLPVLLRTLLVLEGGRFGTLVTKGYLNPLLQWAGKPEIDYRHPASITGALEGVSDVMEEWAAKVGARSLGDRASIPWHLCEILRERSTDIINHWIFQGHPDAFDVDTYLKEQDDILWSVRQHRGEIHIGDHVLIWRAKVNSGVVAVCTVESESALQPDDAPDKWKKSGGEPDYRCRLRIDDRFVDHPIPRDAIKAALPNLSIIQQAAGTNFPIAAEEYATILTLKSVPPKVDPLAAILQRYHDEQILFTSSEHKRRYVVDSIDENGVFVARLDGQKPERVTFASAERLVQSVQAVGSREFMALDDTAAVRNTVLQAEPLALTPNQSSVAYLADQSSRLENFRQVLVGMNRVQPLYKPAMLLCVLDGLDSSELSSNQITFDWIAPRFIALMKTFGEPVAEQQAAQPFYHLSNDLFWLHAVQNRNDLMESGSEGPNAARNKIKYALLKDTYWNLLQDPVSRRAIRRHLEKLIMPTPDQLLSAAETAIAATGFQCPSGLVRRFLGALAAKPFIILTGNSGTGKTLLAKLIADWLSPAAPAHDADPFRAGAVIESDRIKYYVHNGDAQSVEFWNSRQEDQATKVSLPRQIIREWADVILSRHFSQDTPARTIREAVSPTSKYSSQLHSFETHLKAAALALLNAQAALKDERLSPRTGYVLVPVGADWTDNRNVVGFVNHLRKNSQGNPIYQTTPVLELLLRATADPTHPYFLILDEMNLSHVERYFADFLSAMESKKPIPLHHEEKSLQTPSGAAVPQALAFPENLFVIGTVNVDETTYMFSPKVLDRANVLEFRIGTEQAKDFLSQNEKHVTPKPPAVGAPLAFLELSRRACGLAEPALASPTEAELAECRQSVQGFFDLLHSARLEFAFRTINEITRSIHVDFEFAADKSKWRWQDCIDAQVLQKILPKLHGSRRRLEAILIALASYCERRDLDASKKPLQHDAELGSYLSGNAPSEVAFPLSRTKLLEMIEAVRRDQFVSFIQ